MLNSEGLDGIDPLVARKTIDIVTNIISDIINSSFEMGLVPSELKAAIITPIYKQGDKLYATNRPISILPYFAKIMEKAMCSRLNSYIDRLSILYPRQYGFRTGHSSYLALVNIQDLITNAIDSNKHAVGIFLDLAKAFDMVDHNLLIQKIRSEV